MATAVWNRKTSNIPEDARRKWRADRSLRLPTTPRPRASTQRSNAGRSKVIPRFPDQATACRAVFRCANCYNTRRRHSAIGNITLHAYETASPLRSSKRHNRNDTLPTIRGQGPSKPHRMMFLSAQQLQTPVLLLNRNSIDRPIGRLSSLGGFITRKAPLCLT